MKSTIRILHLPSVVGGNPQSISRHLNRLGLKSETWTFRQNYIGYPVDKTLFKETDSLFFCELKRLFFLTYVFRFDVVFFNSGQTLFPQLSVSSQSKHGLIIKLIFPIYRVYADFMQRLELFLLRSLRRVLLIQYQGDDARQGDYSLAHFPITFATEVEDGYYTHESDDLKRTQILRLTGVSYKTYALNPDLLHVLPKDSEFLPYSHISLHDWQPFFTQMETRPVRIGHAPSHRRVKGTELLLEALESLKLQGFSFELVLVEGLNNAEAKERYKTIDVLVDQLFAGWYGGLAVEAMALGKPVIAYIRDGDLDFLPLGMREDLPIIRAEPATIEAVLRQVLEMNRSELLELAKRSRAYVEKWHDPVRIAERIRADIELAFRENA